MENKRKVSIIVPYFRKDGSILMYFQKRSKDAKRLPGYFGFFGGGREGEENPEQTLRRELKEELGCVFDDYIYFKEYEFDDNIKSVFILQVDDGFDRKIKILEGDYGKWFKAEEALTESKLINHDKIVIREVCDFLRVHNKL